MTSSSDPTPAPPPAPQAGPANPTVDAEEVARFEALAAEWWDPDGRFKPLHRFNPERVRFVRDQACAHFGPARAGAITDAQPFSGLDLLDIGTGGGLVAEPMARLGARVTGIDPSAKNIGTAQAHARQMGLDITYRAATAEMLAQESARFDLVIMLEVVEHVADVTAFFEAATALVKPGGMLIAATLNRTLKSYALAIVGAEYVMRWLPVGTHHWNKFLTPEELSAHARACGLHVQSVAGMIYNPLTGRWRTGTDTSVNYMLSAIKSADES
ncbi:MAG: 2-polyprenyl-6-hydroxyphenyl methylase/3-demethylubiquinone-9 3-methyltransferase [Alphaproteobacteria bacterium]|jgi:2-polyprenyl-6-hydroxyphenyl methylase/3-demethylubiquinone-9 3-methyltransferase